MCSAAVRNGDGIVNTFIGDAALAIFNFSILRDNHVSRAVRAEWRSASAGRSQKLVFGVPR